MMVKVKRSIFSENLNHFSPDDFSEEEKMIKSTVKQFVENKVYPQLPEMEAHNYDVIRSLFKESGELDRKSKRLNSSHVAISYAVFCLKNKRTFLMRRA